MLMEPRRDGYEFRCKSVGAKNLISLLFNNSPHCDYLGL